jgi:hypothetical protein
MLATEGFDELRFTVRLSTKPFAARSGLTGTPIDGAGAESIIESKPLDPAGMIMDAGDGVIVAVTAAWQDALRYPGAEAVMAVVPILFPVTTTCVGAVVDPGGKNRAVGEILTTELSLLDNVTIRPPAGAGVPNARGKPADCPSGTDTKLDKVSVPWASTVTVIVVSAIAGGAPMWITAVPGPTACTGTTAVALPAGMVTVEGTAATDGVSDETDRGTEDVMGHDRTNAALEVAPC